MIQRSKCAEQAQVSRKSSQKTQSSVFRQSKCKYILCIFFLVYFFMLQGSKCVEQAELNGN